MITGWLSDEDLTSEGRKRQSWAGSISLPRELFIQTTHDVIASLSTPLMDLPGFEIVPSPPPSLISSSSSSSSPVSRQSTNTSTLHTLGIRPPAEITLGRKLKIDLANGEVMDHCQCWEAEMILQLEEEEYGEVGFDLDFDNGTGSVLFNPLDEDITVRRPLSTDESINTSIEKGKHTLFRITNPNSTRENETLLEAFHLRLFFDTKILEVFANDRFALSTHVYGGDCAVSLRLPPNQPAAKIDRACAWRYY